MVCTWCFYALLLSVVVIIDGTKSAPVLSLTRPVVATTDDGEEYRTKSLTHYKGEVVLDSSDLELCRETSIDVEDPRYQYVGLRFIDVTVPQGAIILSAVVEFVVDSEDSKSSNKIVGIDEDVVLTITGEYVDNASPFVARDFDISRRTTPGTPNIMTWFEREEWKDYTTRSTSDISPIIQDIVSRSGWRSGNALVLVVAGIINDKGTRVAYSRLAGPQLGPKLKLDYTLGPEVSPTSPSQTFNPTPSPSFNRGAAPCPTRDPNGVFARGCIKRENERPPTLPPTHEPTFKPTQSPTSSPTLSPTKSPTFSPTIEPTNQPTPSPTLEPTTSPTQAPTLRPTQAPTSSPTSLPTRPPTKSPTLEPTLEPTQLPTTLPFTDFPSVVPKIPSTPLPTQIEKDPNPPPSSLIVSSDDGRGTGKTCSGNTQCVSKTCRNGVCMASSECYPVKHKYGKPFDKNSINLVFVGSAFDTTTHEAWREQVNATYGSFRNFTMFSEDIEQLNVFLVDPDKLSGSFCFFGCVGVDRLLCCDTDKAQRLSSQCFPVGANLQTVVIHNDEKYGGAGFTQKNIATVSTHPMGTLVAVHELGHSLFELTDEYTYGNGNEIDPNCAATRNCSKWLDLIDNTPEGYDPVSCVPGCRNGNFYVGGASYMNDLGDPVGAVNQRFTCCTYQALTKSMPSYCDAFDFSPNYLFDYCKNHDYQHYGRTNYDVETALQIKAPLHSNSITLDDDVKYVFVTEPLMVKIRLRKNGKAVSRGEPVRLPQGMYHKAQVMGDFRSLKHATKLGMDSVLKLKVVYRTGKDILFFSRNATIEVPFSYGDDNTTQDGEPRSVSRKSNVVDIILDTMGRKLKRVRPQLLTTEKTMIT